MQDADTAAERALWALRAYDTAAIATMGEAGPHVAGVFIAPQLSASGGIELVIAAMQGSRLLDEMRRDPRVAFLCSPGNASRWVQGAGIARMVEDTGRRSPLFQRLTEHAPGAAAFIGAEPVVPVLVQVHALKVVEAADRPALRFRFDPTAGGHLTKSS